MCPRAANRFFAAEILIVQSSESGIEERVLLRVSSASPLKYPLRSLFSAQMEMLAPGEAAVKLMELTLAKMGNPPNTGLPEVWYTPCVSICHRNSRAPVIAAV